MAMLAIARTAAKTTFFVGSLLSGIGLAAAADLPVKARPVAHYDWTGLYVGAVAAGGWGHSEHCDPLTGCAAGSADFNISGWLAGATVGYNWQWTNWVFGAEVDWSWGKIKGSVPTGIFDCGSGGTCNTEISSVATVRGRFGYAFDRLLPYVTAGAAFTHVHASDGGTNFFIDDSTTKTSFVWGGGVEYAFAPQWSAKLEYLRVEDIGDFTYGHVTGICACFLTDTHYELVRLGVNYRLGGH
jgi:outer membrane immunogenic protein